jgi:hypothetical protein
VTTPPVPFGLKLLVGPKSFFGPVYACQFIIHLGGGGGDLRKFFYIYFIKFLQKVYGPAQILQKYTSGAVGRGARCRQEWALTRNAKGHGVRALTPWPSALGA